MSLKKLFGAVSAVAILGAGAASAQSLSLTTPAANQVNVAEELVFTGGVVNGVSPILVLETLANLPVANGYLLTLNITGSATLGRTGDAVAAGDVDSLGGLETIISNATPSSVVFILNTTANDVGATNDIEIMVPLTFTGCSSDVSFNVTLTDSNDNPIEGGQASLRATGGMGTPLFPDLYNCVNAFQASIASDVAPAVLAPAVVGGGIGGVNTLLELDTDFSSFVVSAPDVAGTATVGILDVFVDTTAVGANLSTPVGLGNIAGIDFDAVFADLTGLGDLEINGGPVAGPVAGAVAAMSTIFSFELPTPVGMGNATITLDTDSPAASITPQQPTIVDAMLDLGTGFVDEPILVVGAGLDGLELEGANFGPFDWVGDSNTIAQTVFRGTGIDTADLPAAAVTLTNSSLDNNGTMTIDLASLTIPPQNGQVVILNSDITNLFGPFGIADVTITLFDSSVGLDFDRLILTDGVVSSFGDTGNFSSAPVTD